MDKDELKPSTTERVRWEDEEAARPSRAPALRRTHSAGSMSITSVRANREVDPSIALPIQYRTVYDCDRNTCFARGAYKLPDPSI